MKALSIRQPWAHAIICYGKNIENRTWNTNYRGPVLIHASKKFDDHGWIELLKIKPSLETILLASPNIAQTGGIVGYAEIVDCVMKSKSKWFSGPYGFVLKHQRPVAFLPMKGRLSLFDVPDEIANKLIWWKQILQ